MNNDTKLIIFGNISNNKQHLTDDNSAAQQNKGNVLSCETNKTHSEPTNPNYDSIFYIFNCLIVLLLHVF